MELKEAIFHARRVEEGYANGQLADWLEELQIYRQARQEGLLIILPRKVGTDFYDVRQFYNRSKVVNTELVKMTVDHYTIGQAGIPIATACSGKNEWGDYKPHQLLTFEEAQEALSGGNKK